MERNNYLEVVIYREGGKTIKGSYIIPIIVGIFKIITMSYAQF